MEPFRHLVERTACSVLNRRELQAEDFHSDPELGCRIDKPALRRYLARLAEAMTRRMTTLEEDRGDFHDLMLRQLRSLDRLRRAQADPTPWFFRTR